MSESGGKMKHIDAFLKKLKTDRNTFVTYVLTMFSIYIVVDRLVEILFIAGTGMAVSYWGPIKYTLALACLTFAVHIGFASKFVTEDTKKLSFLYIYVIGFYIVAVSMLIQWVNKIEWVLFFTVPNYSYILQNFAELVKPAFSAFAWYLPIVTFYPVFKKCYTWINDTKDIYDSVFDYGGIDLSNTKEGWGPYTCEMLICKDSESGKIIKIPEARRFESSLIVGVSGSGKTSMMFEPMIARDFEKKFFFRETSKEMGYTALRTGLATLSVPYSNEYLNENFNLNMLTVSPGKEKLYKAFMSKLIITSNDKEYTYKNLGLTYMAPDYESITHMKEVADCFGLKYHIIDPNNPEESAGFNPFCSDDPTKVSISVSSILQTLYLADFNTTKGVMNAVNAQVQAKNEQALQNLIILLKVAYPILNNNDLPNLEDLLNLMTDFEEVEKLCKVLLDNEELAQQYSHQLKYFRMNFFKDAELRTKTMEDLSLLSAQIEQLLRYDGVKKILCKRNNNLNYDDILKNGEIVFVCTRRGDLGDHLHKGFGLFFLLSMKYSVLTRPGTERTRSPYFLYVDEFYPFVCHETVDIYTLYRKYRVGLIISSQNLTQFGDEKSFHRQTIMANCTTKVVFGNNTPEDNEWWRLEFGDKREWDFKHTYNTSPKGNEANPEYDQAYRDIKCAWKKNYEAGKIQSLKFKQIIYKTKDLKGKNIVGKAKLDFLEARYKEEQKVKTYDFSKFVAGVQTSPQEAKDYVPETRMNGPITVSLKNTAISRPRRDDYDDPIQNAITDFNNDSDNDNNNNE